MPRSPGCRACSSMNRHHKFTSETGERVAAGRSQISIHVSKSPRNFYFPEILSLDRVCLSEWKCGTTQTWTRPFWSDCHPADGGGGTHARQTIRWRVLGGPCAWVARRCPPPPARRSPPPHLALGTSASLRLLHSSSLRAVHAHRRPLCLGRALMSSAAGPPLARPQQPLHHVPVHHVDSCCCSRCLRAAAPCPPPCRALPRTVLTTPRPSHPQPSARNRPGERMNLLDWMNLLDYRMYTRPDAEVLPLITPAAARARDPVRRISHATLGTAPPGGEAIDGAGAGEGPQGEAAARPYDSAHSPSLARPPQAPCPSHPPPPTSPLTLLSLLLCSTHSTGTRPFTAPLCTAHRWRWCRRSSRRTRRPPRRGPRYAAPSPLAAWMRGPERSSEVIRCNQGQSGVIIRNQRALSGTQRALSATQSHSVATRWAPQRPSAGPSEAIRGTQWLIRGDQRYSEALRGHQRPLRATQSHSVAFSGTQRRSEGPRHAVFTAPRPA
jgi:hypothetical protein